MRSKSPGLRPLGALEERVMEILWEVAPLSVREVTQRLGGKLAYTTVMTTLDRLYRKGLSARTKDGNAFLYTPALTRDAYHRRVAEQALSGLLSRSTEPVLAGFLDAAAAVDEENLSRLERLIAARRRSRR